MEIFSVCVPLSVIKERNKMNQKLLLVSVLIFSSAENKSVALEISSENPLNATEKGEKREKSKD